MGTKVRVRAARNYEFVVMVQLATRWAGQTGGPSLRLKNGFAQDDKVV
jgi:hypothetical protein